MKRTLIKVTLAALAVVLLGSCEKINQRIDALEERLDGIETEKIASIDSQIASINSSIADLGTIRSNITSLRSQVDDHSTDIFNLEEADRALNDRILNLEDYLDDVLPTYAEKDWVKATFSTLAQYEATCDTIAKIDARIGKLDERLSKEIKACADSMKKWVNVQFEAYYTAAEMDAALSDMQDQIDSLKSGSSEYKLDSLANELTKTKAAVDSAKAQLTREYKAAIDTAITHCEGRLTKALTDAITKVNDDITALTTRVSNLEVFVATLTGRVTDLEGMIQSVTIVPAYSDGSVKVEEDILYLDCIISPASAVSTLTKANFTVLVNEVLTKAVNIKTIRITEDAWFSKDASKGTVSLKVPVENDIPKTAGKSITVAVNVKNGISDYTTEFVPVANENYYVSLGENYSGDYTLPKTNGSVYIEIGNTDGTVNLKYAEGFKPNNIFIKVVGEGATVAKLTGDLEASHVEFILGKINEVQLTTSASTFVVKHPAEISTKLTVTGGNVKVEGAKVAAIEVAANATADGVKAPVEIVMEKDGSTAPAVTNGITAKANVVVAPAENVTVMVTVEGDVKVANGGKGTVNDGSGQPINNGAAQIGDIKYVTLADAIDAVKDGETIKMLGDVAKAAGISVISGKNFTVDFGGHKYAMECPGAGSTATKTSGFQLLKNSTIVFKNGTIQCTEANKTKTWTSDATSKGIAMMIQNYANLTLDSLTIDATNIAHNGAAVRYALSNNCGNVEYKGTTTIITAGTDYAFDVCKYDTYDAPTVTWNSIGTVNGGIELSGGTFVVAKNLVVSAPVMAAEGESTLEIVTGATLSPATNFSDPNPNISNHATGTAPVQVKRGASLTICGDGVVDSKSVASAVIVTVKGDDSSKTANLTVDGKVTLQGKYYGISGNGDRQNTNIAVKGGNIKGTEANDCAGIYHPQSGSLNISGGTIEGAVGIYVKAGTVSTSVEGGEIKGTGIQKDYSTQGSGFVATGDAIVFDNCDYPGGEPNATINGGTFISSNGKAVASYAKTSKTPISPVINGGTFSDESAIKYAAKDANITIKLLADRTAGTGVFVKSGQNQTITFDLNGKKYIGVGPAVGSTGTTNQLFHIEKGNTVTLKNGKISISESAKTSFKFIIQNYSTLNVEGVELDGTNLGISGGSTFSNNNGTVSVTGNTSIKAAANGVALDAYYWPSGGYSEGVNVTVNTTGTITGKVEFAHDDTVTDEQTASKSSLKIIAGNFTDMSGVNYVADNKTYTLAGDVTLDTPLEINSGKTFTIDLNNKKLTGRTNIKHGNVTFEKGTIETTGEVQALNVYGSTDSTKTNYSVVTIASNVTVNAGVYGVCVFGNTATTTGYGAVANIEGKVTTIGDGKNGAVFVSGNLGAKSDDNFAVSNKNAVKIYGKANITSSTDAAIALNGSATVTVEDGVGLTGATAIAAKRGKLIVKGGTITGTGTCVGNPTKNSNGIENTGSAVSATNYYKADGPLSVEINGGEFTSKAYTILNNHDGCEFKISAGHFTTSKADGGIAVYARLGSVNITGGLFENNSNSEATLHVGCPSVESCQPKLTISGDGTCVINRAQGTYSYGEGEPLVVNMANELTYKAVEISGGLFYRRDPSNDDNVTSDYGNFLKAGYFAKKHDATGWIVYKKE